MCLAERKRILTGTVLSVLQLFLLLSCIRNDIPHPIIKAQLLEFETVGQIGPAIIDYDDRTVLITLADTIDLRNVRVKKAVITDQAVASVDWSTGLDLTAPLRVTLSLYQDYLWQIIARQDIFRTFRIDNQIGEATIDVENRRVIAYVTKDTDVRNIQIREMTLGPTGAQIFPVYADLHDFSDCQEVMVTYRDITETWKIYVTNTDREVFTGAVDAWVNVAWLHGSGRADADNGFEYREVLSDTWVKVDPNAVIRSGGNFFARIAGLKASAKYLFRAYSDDLMGDEVEFTTEAAVPLENGTLDDWSLDGKVWNPWAENGTPFWSSGNRGSATLGESNTLPSDDIWKGKNHGKAGKLESRFVGIAGIGKFAAGNLFVGDFVRVDGTNGILNFGKPYSSYPTKLRCRYKYTSEPINYTSTEYSFLKGEPDTCSIYIALGDWDKQVEIRTKPSNRKLFDKNDPNIIAYAEFYSGVSVTDYQELELTLDYRVTDRKPTYIIVVCSASKYGDFFTGGTGSVLYIDELELLFDY